MIFAEAPFEKNIEQIKVGAAEADDPRPQPEQSTFETR